MSRYDVQRVAAALLYEGYMLYPYRPSAIKNRRRFNFGIVAPTQFMQTECLVHATPDTRITAEVRFLQLDDQQNATERTVRVVEDTTPFAWPPIAGRVELSSMPRTDDVRHVRVRIVNDRASEPMLSTHTILSVTDGEWISLLDPPNELRDEAAACENVGTWPVLAGEPGQRTTMLSSPIIIYDYPSIAPESPGDLFDATEIDEILSLRILTLTDDEQREIRHADALARQLLERTQALTAEDFMGMHGTMRRPDETR
jgi:hypothetical protein